MFSLTLTLVELGIDEAYNPLKKVVILRHRNLPFVLISLQLEPAWIGAIILPISLFDNLVGPTVCTVGFRCGDPGFDSR